MKKFTAILLFLLIAISSHGQINLTQGLQAQYDFNGNANDITGNGFDGTVNGATLAADRLGNSNSAYHFDGTNQNITVQGFQNMISGDEVSISFWMKADILKSQAVFLLFPDDHVDRLFAGVYYDHGGISSTFWDYGDMSGAGRLGAVGTYYQSVWENYVFVVSASQNMMEVYRNGYLQFFKTGMTPLINKNRTLSIGGNMGDNGASNFFFVGSLDDIRIYDRVLNPAEINCLYHGYYNLNVNDLRVFVTNYPNARPGFQEQLNVIYQNVGTTTLNGYVELNYDANYSLVQATPVQDSINTNYLGWYVNNIAPGAQGVLQALVYLPASVPLGTILSSDATIYPLVGDTVPTDNYSALRQTVVGGYDPNYIEVSPDSNVTPDFVTDGDYLYYTVHFQNTGTASAINVRVEDQLDPDFIISSAEIIGASHSYSYILDESPKLTFLFDNINLPDSGTSFFGSSGFVTYRIKCLPTLIVGDQLTNNANIFFDFNQPVLTNTVTTTIVNPLSVYEPGNTADNLYTLFPNPFTDKINITCGTNNPTEIILYDITSRKLVQRSFINSLSLSTAEFSKGIYFYSLTDKNGLIKKGKLVKQ